MCTFGDNLFGAFLSFWRGWDTSRTSVLGGGSWIILDDFENHSSMIFYCKKEMPDPEATSLVYFKQVTI